MNKKVLFFQVVALTLSCLSPFVPTVDAQQEHQLPTSSPDITKSIRAARDPQTARFSGRMHAAVAAVIEYRRALQKLRPSERLAENFLFEVRIGVASDTLLESEQSQCIEVGLLPQLQRDEQVLLDRADMALGRYATYVVCGPNYSVVRFELGDAGFEKARHHPKPAAVR
jgi:hypothetical protein